VRRNRNLQIFINSPIRRTRPSPEGRIEHLVKRLVLRWPF
jgi:hypothetical protein